MSEWPASYPPIAEGKTKIIFPTPERGIVKIQSKDDITAGDGARRDVIAGKAALATRTTANVFTLLTRLGIPNHFIGQVSDTEFLATELDMIPVECVARRIATGSYLERNPQTREGTVFPDLVIEFFYKENETHDPLLELNPDGSWSLYKPKSPNKQDLVRTEPPEFLTLTAEDLEQMRALTVMVFETLESAWADMHPSITLVDLKIEPGRRPDGKIVMGDVVDNDSWRLWPGGIKGRQLDKQVYRDTLNVTDAILGEIRSNYELVALLTDRFQSLHV